MLLSLLSHHCHTDREKIKWAASWQNQQSDCAPSKDADQHPDIHPVWSRIFAVRMKKAWVLNYPLSAQWRLWSDWVDAQADLHLRWVHSHFVGFVIRWLKSWFKVTEFWKVGWFFGSIYCKSIYFHMPFEPKHNKTYNITYVQNADSDHQPG